MTQKAGMYTLFEGVPSAHWNPVLQSKETPQISYTSHDKNRQASEWWKEEMFLVPGLLKNGI